MVGNLSSEPEPKPGKKKNTHEFNWIILVICFDVVLYVEDVGSWFSNGFLFFHMFNKRVKPLT